MGHTDISDDEFIIRHTQRQIGVPMELALRDRKAAELLGATSAALASLKAEE